MDWTADSISHLATGYWSASALSAAIELGVFASLSVGPAAADVIAQRAGGQTALVAALLDALVSLGLLTRVNARYAISASAVPLLSTESPTSMLGALAYNVDLMRQWTSLAGVIRSGQPVTQPSADVSADATQRFVRGMESKARAFAPQLLPLIDLNGASRLLDVGAGPGTVSRMLAERYPALAVTLLDLPEVLAVAKTICAGSPIAPSLRFHPADYRRDSLPGPFDAILYAGALHQESVNEAAALMQKCFAALRPGGTIVVIDLMLDASRTQPTFSAMFQLNMLLSRPSARVFSEPEVIDLLSGAGFGVPTVRRPAASPYVVVTARKPS